MRTAACVAILLAFSQVSALDAADDPRPASPSRIVLGNDSLVAEFDASGLTRLSSPATQQTLNLAGDSAAVTVSGQRLAIPDLKPADIQVEKESVTYGFVAGDYRLRVVYQLKPGWHFVTKQLFLTLPAGASRRVDAIELFAADLKRPIAREHRAASATGAVFLRFAEPNGSARSGVFLALQNPFLKWERKDGHVAMAYAPEMEWRADYGPFASDRVCIGLYRLSGTEFPAHNLGEWKYVREPSRAFDGVPTLDLAESEAMTRCVDAFVLFRPMKSVRVHVPWCENDYQIDVAAPAGRAEWKRILDQCAAVGVEHALFTPANSAIAPLADNADAWGWENCLWLGLGQKIRKGQWDVAKDPLPASIQEMLDYAKARNIKLVAYAYPTLGWKQNPEWTAWCGGKTGGYVGVDTGVRSFQDWFVDQLVAFQKRTGIGGYSFDHWWIAYEPTQDGKKPTSKYAQWFGCRRILEELRRRVPDAVIDGRQQYQWFGAWTWLGGSYPHPTTNDEQPGSFENFPDLHFSRVSGDRQRWASWYYHMEQFAPWELVPGYMTHQTPRNNAVGQCVRDRPFHTRDWDYLGWRYSVISSIGTAPFNHVVDLLPARDADEFAHFGPADQRWLRQWMDWTDEHRALLGRLRPILGPPVLGRVDGTAAVAGDRGFVFLYNPNYRALEARFALDASIGLSAGDRFLLRELYPRAGRLLGKPGDGTWRLGETVSLAIKGPAARVVEIVPAAEAPRPALLNASGKAIVDGDRLVLSEVEGQVGAKTDLVVLLPPGRKPSSVRVNGRQFSSFTQEGDALRLPVTFAGAPFDHCQQVGGYDPDFSRTTFRAEFTVPARVFEQLTQRRKAWPIPYTQEELLATWRGSDRLLLYVHLADPDDKWPVGLKLNGEPVAVKKAYSDVFPLGRERTFTGFYADVSHVKPDTRYEVEVALPEGLQPGQFQGLFFENAEAEFTTEIAP
ncbi:MAG: hypothetical protein ACYC35_12620 [Pirellulales bacterium]